MNKRSVQPSRLCEHVHPATILGTDFPFGRESGVSTKSPTRCGICGTRYTTDPRKPDDWIRYIEFGDLVIVKCCFFYFERALVRHEDEIKKFFAAVKKAKRAEKKNCEKCKKQKKP